MAIDETLLEQMSQDIEHALKAKRLSPSERRRLQMDRLQIALMRDSIETKRKVEVMWMWFRPMAAAMSVAATAIIGFLVVFIVTGYLK